MSKKKRMKSELDTKQIGANELSDEDMGNISGGYVHYNGKKWEIIDRDGNIKGTASLKFIAQARAYFGGQLPTEINDKDLYRIKVFSEENATKR